MRHCECIHPLSNGCTRQNNRPRAQGFGMNAGSSRVLGSQCFLFYSWVQGMFFTRFFPILTKLKALKTHGRMLWHAFRHADTPKWIKGFMLAVVVYLFSPIDMIPDFLVLFGITDDLRWDTAKCSFFIKPGLLVFPDKFATTFLYSSYQIEKVVSLKFETTKNGIIKNSP